MTPDTATACRHHWHRTGNSFDYARSEKVTVSSCCHCGETQEIRVPMYGRGQWPPSDEPPCGPHKPREWVMNAKAGT